MRAIEWGDAFPADIRTSAEPLVDELELLLPDWADPLVVRYKPKQKGRIIAQFRVDAEYRRAVMYIRPPWIGASDAERRDTILHEFSHAFTYGLFKLAGDLLAPYHEEGDALVAPMAERVRMENEGATEDLSRAFARALSSRRKK